MPFKKGQSGNPGGRPKLPPEMVEVRTLARAYTAEAVAVLAGIMRDPNAPANARASAASLLLDRGHGRAPAVIDATVRHDVRDCTDAELLAVIAAARSVDSENTVTH